MHDHSDDQQALTGRQPSNKATLIYRRTKNLRAVQHFLGHTNAVRHGRAKPEADSPREA